MSTSDQQMSLLFYDYLCKIIGTEEVVYTRRQICHAYDTVGEEMYHHVFSGSKAEGLDFKESDVDIMLVDKRFTVLESKRKTTGNDSNKLFLIMDYTDTKPGFTRLKLLPEVCWICPELSKICEYEGQEIYLSSKKHLQRKDIDHDSFFFHGPCLSTKNKHFDYAPCFHCKEWVSPAMSWVKRSRKHWPSCSVGHSIVQHGVCFVLIGSKGSKHEDTEFRLSFSVAEKILIHSFNHVQLFCYALMKIVLKDILKEKHGESLCSYFMKTIMFWLCEETDPSVWRAERLLSCFMACFKRLIYCVKIKTCMHYFVADNDLFETRFTKNEHDKLLVTLYNLYKFDWPFLLQTKTLQSFLTSSRNQSISALPILMCTYGLTLRRGDFFIQSKNILRIEDKESRCLSMFAVNKAMAYTTSLLKVKNNKSFYRQHKTCVSHLMMGTQFVAVAGWLLLASLFYHSKQYNTCLNIIGYCLSEFTPDKVMIQDDIDIESQHAFNENMKIMQKIKKRKAFRWTCKCMIIRYVVLDINSCLFPKELLEVSDLLCPAHLFTPHLFALFLQCACTQHLAKDGEKDNALHTTLTKLCFIINNIDWDGNTLKTVNKAIFNFFSKEQRTQINKLAARLGQPCFPYN